jgi:excisionase family DNA binding protein
VIVLTLDAATAGQLALAIRRHRAYLRANGYLVPAGLADIQAAAEQVVRDKSRQTRTLGDTAIVDAATTSQVGHGDCEPLTIGQVAAQLGVSTRTVGRMLERGDLAGVPVGRRRRITRHELDRYLNEAA